MYISYHQLLDIVIAHRYLYTLAPSVFPDRITRRNPLPPPPPLIQELLFVGKKLHT